MDPPPFGPIAVWGRRESADHPLFYRYLNYSTIVEAMAIPREEQLTQVLVSENLEKSLPISNDFEFS